MLKRSFDLLASICLAIFLLPLILLISYMIYRKLGTPIFFSQMRPGLKGKPFKLIKFRTMLEPKQKKDQHCTEEHRLTKFGRFLRSTSLDELPELWNVIRGEMSLIGPRPLLMEYLSLYSNEQMQRHNVRPGITGWAQINGRNSLSWENKFFYDLWYVDNQSFLLDCKILLITIKKVFMRDGINADEQVSMEKFKGTAK